MPRFYTVDMKAKTILAAALALFIGSCSCVMSLASAAAAASKQDHSCCPSAPKAEKASECCMRAALPSPTVLAGPHFVVLGLAPQPVAPVLNGLGIIVRPNTLSPPDESFAASRSSRAPPSLIA